jgi:hypothetical protein
MSVASNTHIPGRVHTLSWLLLFAVCVCVCVCVCGVQVRDGSGDEEVLDRAGDAVQNLAAFIDYKKAHLPR